jgi:ubiquinone/menaquinone biosynthesis C-methylase UbiE
VTEQPPRKHRQPRAHDLAWQSEAVVAAYDERRFSSITGPTFDPLEKRAIGRLLTKAEATDPIRTVLDVPCGTGRISEMLLKRGYTVTCGDISPAMLAAAQKRLSSYRSDQVRYVASDVYALEFPDGAFDCVTSIRLFQHLTSEERGQALRELARVSKRYVIAGVVFTSTYYALVRKLRLALGAYAPRHTASEQDIRREVAHAGLRVVARHFPQPGYSGGLILLLEKTGR